MAISTISEFLQNIRRTVLRRDEAGLTDGQLLEVYIHSHEEAAFAALLHRHGPMVWGVCCRVLGNKSDAEDAFQATFLVLVRKAASVVPREQIASWLYGVARQTAIKARAMAVKRKSREKQVKDFPEPARAQQEDSDELLSLLDQELGRLPEKYRTAIVLCDLEGKSYKEAARQLRCPEGTLAARLTRGRTMLAKRLARHGRAVTSGALAVVLSQSSSANVPASMLSSTIHAASFFAAGKTPATGLISARVVALSDKVLRGMLLTKLKIAIAIVLGLAITVVGAGASRLYLPEAAEEPDKLATADDTKGMSERMDLYGDPLPEGALARLGTERFRPGRHERMALSPDGRTVVTSAGYWDETRFWDTATGKLIRSFKGGGRVVCYSPDGRLVATADAVPENGDIKKYICKVNIWDAATGKRLAELSLTISASLSLGFSPDGSILAVSGVQLDKQGKSDSFIGLWHWDGTSLKLYWEAKPDQKLPFESDRLFTSLAFSADGKYLATGGVLNSVIHIWKVGDGKEIRQLKASGTQVPSLAFAPTGNSLASGSDSGAVVLWDLANGTKHWESKQTGKVLALAFAPDGKTLAVGSVPWGPLDQAHAWSYDQPILVLLDATSGKETQRLATSRQPIGRDGVRSAAFSKDGKVLVALQGARLRFWEGTTGKERPGPAGNDESIYAVAVSEDGRMAATAGIDCSLILWDLLSGKEIRRFEGHRDAVVAARFVPGGKLLVSASAEHDQTVRVWDVANGKEVRQLKVNPRGCLNALAVSPDGKLLAASDHLDGTIYVWDLATTQLLHTLRNGASPRMRGALRQPASNLATGINCLAFSPDSKILAGGEVYAHGRKNHIVLWSASTGKKLHSFPADDQGVMSLSFAPDGHQLASTGWSSQSIDLWDVDSGNKLFDLPCIPYGVVAFSPDGKTLAWESNRGTIKEKICLWEIASRQVRRQFSGSNLDGVPPFPHTLAFSGDGRTMVSAKGCTALVWDVTGLRSEAKTQAVLSPEKLQTLWKALASSDAAEAGRAIWALTADPKGAAPFLAKRLCDLPAMADRQRIRQLIAALDSEEFKVRQEAETQLESLGKLAESALRETLAHKPSLEVSRRITHLLEKRHIVPPQAMQGLRAIEVLEHMASVEARQALKDFAKQTTDDFYRHEAQAAALRLKQSTRSRD